MSTWLTLQVTGLSTNLCSSVDTAGSSTKGTRKRKANIQMIQVVPRMREVKYLNFSNLVSDSS